MHNLLGSCLSGAEVDAVDRLLERNCAQGLALTSDGMNLLLLVWIRLLLST